MIQIAMFAYALAVGLTLAGIVATLVELTNGRRIGFRPPFITADRFALSLALTVVAGPAMIANEAIAARREGVIEWPVLGICLTIAVAWCTATGILLVDLALALSRLLG